MQTATLTWQDPTTKITSIEVSMQVQGAPGFTVLGTALPGVQRFQVPDLVDGTYSFKVTAINGTKRASGVVVSGTVESTPSDVANLIVTFI